MNFEELSTRFANASPEQKAQAVNFIDTLLNAPVNRVRQSEAILHTLMSLDNKDFEKATVLLSREKDAWAQVDLASRKIDVTAYGGADPQADRLLRKELKEVAKKLSKDEAANLVRMYYNMQDDRIAKNNRAYALEKMPNTSTNLVSYLAASAEHNEKVISAWMDAWTDNDPMGRWLREIRGIGPVLAAGLIANLDFTVKYSSQFHFIAGLTPSANWLGVEKSTNLINEIMGTSKKFTSEHFATLVVKSKRSANHVRKLTVDPNSGEYFAKATIIANFSKPPYNMDLKSLCWMVGECFVKTPADKAAGTYREVYDLRKAIEKDLNDRGMYAAQAAEELKSKKFGDNVTRKALEAGKLSDGHIHSRAKRYAVKLFLSHLHTVGYEFVTGQPAAVPYIISHKGPDGREHLDYTPPLNTNRPVRNEDLPQE